MDRRFLLVLGCCLCCSVVFTEEPGKLEIKAEDSAGIEAALSVLDESIRNQDLVKFRGSYLYSGQQELAGVDAIFYLMTASYELRKTIIARFGEDHWAEFQMTRASFGLPEVKCEPFPLEKDWWKGIAIKVKGNTRFVQIPNKTGGSPAVFLQSNGVWKLDVGGILSDRRAMFNLRGATRALRAGMRAAGEEGASLQLVRDAIGEELVKIVEELKKQSQPGVGK